MRRVFEIPVYRLTSDIYSMKKGTLGTVDQEYPELEAVFMSWFLEPHRDSPHGCCSTGPIEVKDLERVAVIYFDYEEHGFRYEGDFSRDVHGYVAEHGPSCPDFNCDHEHCAKVRSFQKGQAW